MEELCDPYFSRVKYMEAYERIIHPILDESMWEGEVIGDPIEPPRLRRLPGRPRKNRRREEDEPAPGRSQQRKWHSIICKNCGQVGHNRRTCQRGPVKKRKIAEKTSSRTTSQTPTTSGKEGVAPPPGFGSSQTRPAATSEEDWAGADVGSSQTILALPPPATQSSVADAQSSAATHQEFS